MSQNAVEYTSYSNYEFCLDTDCEDSEFYLGDIDLLRVDFCDNTKVRVFAYVQREVDDIVSFDNIRVIVKPEGEVLTGQKLEAVKSLLKKYKFSSFLQKEIIQHLTWK